MFFFNVHNLKSTVSEEQPENPDQTSVENLSPLFLQSTAQVSAILLMQHYISEFILFPKVKMKFRAHILVFTFMRATSISLHFPLVWLWLIVRLSL